MERKIIYKENSEEYKAIKLLEKMTKNYSLNGEELHYANILYNLIINLSNENDKYRNQQKENEQLKDNWDKLKEDLITSVKYWEEQEKEWINLGFIKFGGEANSKIIFKKVLDKMQKLEKEVTNKIYNILLSKNKISINGKDYDIPREVAEFIIYETSTRDDLIQTKEAYERVINKAIEYIKECISSPDEYEQFLTTYETSELLDILEEVK